METGLIFIDAHCHFYQLALKTSSENVATEIQKCRDAGVKFIIENATGDHTFSDVEKVYLAHPDIIIPAFGCHPLHLDHSGADWEKNLIKYLQKYPKAIVGEAGLDFATRPEHNEAQQLTFLIGQLTIAATYKRPVTIHCIGAHAKLFEVFQELYQEGSNVYETLKGNGYRQVIQMHAYEADIAFANKIVENFPNMIEFFFSISLHIKDEINLTNIVGLPKESIIIETDTPHAGNRPYFLPAFVDKLQGAFGEGVSGFREQVYENTLRFIAGINA
jgi:Tat protein secretion system quality control protein TatD with DNase activity